MRFKLSNNFKIVPYTDKPLVYKQVYDIGTETHKSIYFFVDTVDQIWDGFGMVAGVGIDKLENEDIDLTYEEKEEWRRATSKITNECQCSSNYGLENKDTVNIKDEIKEWNENLVKNGKQPGMVIAEKQIDKEGIEYLQKAANELQIPIIYIEKQVKSPKTIQQL